MKSKRPGGRWSFWSSGSSRRGGSSSSPRRCLREQWLLHCRPTASFPVRHRIALCLTSPQLTAPINLTEAHRKGRLASFLFGFSAGGRLGGF